MDIDSAFPSKYIKASDLQGREVTVVMNQVVIEAVGRNNTDRKPVLYFQGKEKGLVLNKTNSRNISALYSSDTARWAGLPIVLYPAMTDFSGDQVACIRVRAPFSGAAQAPAAHHPQPARQETPPPASGWAHPSNAGRLPPPHQAPPQGAPMPSDDIPF